MSGEVAHQLPVRFERETTHPINPFLFVMSSAKQQVVALIQDYQQAVYQAVGLLNAKSAREVGFQKQTESPGVYAGYLDDAGHVRYHFHGCGCLITTPAFAVDFDYALEGGCTGIDAWFLFDFLKSNSAIRSKFPLLTSGEQVEQLLEELVQEGLLTKYLYAAHDRRYYVTADIGNPNLPAVTLRRSEEDEAAWNAAG